MLTGITIRNFRGLRDVSVDGFSRVNIVVGDNGSGKTSLLEAIFLAMSSSIRSLEQLRHVRLGPTPPPASFESLTEFLTEGGEELLMQTRGTAQLKRKIAGRKGYPSSFSQTVVPAQEGFVAPYVVQQLGASTADVIGKELRIEWNDEYASVVGTIVQDAAGLRIADIGRPNNVGTTFIASHQENNAGVAGIFSVLDKAGDGDYFLEAIRAQFVNIERVSIQLDDITPSLYGKYAGLRQQRPLEYLSGGLARLSTLLLSLSRPNDFVILIDEIENGFHHSRLQILWQQVHDFACRFNKQIFVTTHSQECLDAAADAMAKNPDDFVLVRTVQSPEGILVGKLPGEKARDLLVAGFEVRG